MGDDPYEVLAANYLSVARMCEGYHVLPSAGGLLDQDSLMMHYLSKIQEYDAIRQELDDEHAKHRSQG
jgi:hypothetical protein